MGINIGTSEFQNDGAAFVDAFAEATKAPIKAQRTEPMKQPDKIPSENNPAATTPEAAAPAQSDATMAAPEATKGIEQKEYDEAFFKLTSEA